MEQTAQEAVHDANMQVSPRAEPTAVPAGAPAGPVDAASTPNPAAAPSAKPAEPVAGQVGWLHYEQETEEDGWKVAQKRKYVAKKSAKGKEGISKAASPLRKRSTRSSGITFTAAPLAAGPSEGPSEPPPAEM